MNRSSDSTQGWTLECLDRIRRQRFQLIALLCALAGAPVASAHPNHVSLAEVEWNAKSGKLEVALKLHANDLESVLRRRSGRPLVLETEPEIDRLIQDYLAEVFIVQAPRAKPARLKWVGKEISLKAAWLYFEVPLPGGPQRAVFSNRLFFELLSDQVNTINLRVGEQRKSLSLTRDHAQRQLQLD